MSIKNRLTGLAVLLAMLIVMSISGPLHAQANSNIEEEPMQTENEIVVELNDDYFNPNAITISKGKTTRLLLKNAGQKEHTFTVKKLGIDVELRPGEEKTITVKPQAIGTYQLICRYHQQEGMVGEVIVK
ncbi:cupredoxin domain-containing protein [Oceanobacillus piezotolerans]|uniref:Cupredoxin domain-containing protein n=1 Tax=Oceanobacillus piezotolerans TaxID=2448030 RepID=A0A498D4W5_9BACI|nr:cupredoxin domain-containing protein [Oceanobacillus piezotolerans]RLL43886.1 cupredoxin domain-containing protein [Oceanobacillus piezotolerans]